MSVPMMELIVEPIRDNDQIRCFLRTGFWEKRCLTLSNNTNPKGKYLASIWSHKGAGKARAASFQGEEPG